MDIFKWFRRKPTPPVIASWDDTTAENMAIALRELAQAITPKQQAQWLAKYPMLEHLLEAEE